MFRRPILRRNSCVWLTGKPIATKAAMSAWISSIFCIEKEFLQLKNGLETHPVSPKDEGSLLEVTYGECLLWDLVLDHQGTGCDYPGRLEASFDPLAHLEGQHNQDAGRYEEMQDPCQTSRGEESPQETGRIQDQQQQVIAL